MITITTSLPVGTGYTMCLTAVHDESGIRGYAFRSKDADVTLWRAMREAMIDGDQLDVSKWPLLQEMRHEALQILVDKAESAQSIHHEAVGILTEPKKITLNIERGPRLQPKPYELGETE